MEHIQNINESKKWNISRVTGILNNKVYTGDLIQQKRKRISFKNHKFVKTKDDELIITKNNFLNNYKISNAIDLGCGSGNETVYMIKI